MALGGLKPSEELVTSALAATLVYGIFQLDAPNLADVRHGSDAGNPKIHSSVKTAAWTAAATVAAISILAKSPTVFVVGGLVTVAESWKFMHANTVSKVTNKIDPSAFGNNY